MCIRDRGKVERIGGGSARAVDVRVIAATNRTLEEEVRRGRFREDLFYRLNVFPLTVPPLRQRREDIPHLVEHFVGRFAAAQGKVITRVPQPVMDELVTHDWPGNIRELSNVIERAVITATDDTLRLSAHLSGEGGPPAASGYRGTLDEVEREYIGQVLEGCSWRIEGSGGAADRLGLHPNTLRNRMRKLGLRRPAAPPDPVRQG